ncbi:MAG: helix-turn-helix transcriptional regulator [Spirochaetaceae bacterium]|nr:helix-turn-helix transcriptional regulator [Spirochaetaceae bacterium]
MSRAKIYNRCSFSSTLSLPLSSYSIIIISTNKFTYLGELKLFIRENCNLPVLNIIEDGNLKLLNLLEDEKFKTIKISDFRELRYSINEFKESFGKKICLTKREQQVLSLIVEGYSIDNISYKLGISSKTVVTHKRNIFLKVNVHSNVQLMLWSFDQK